MSCVLTDATRQPKARCLSWRAITTMQSLRQCAQGEFTLLVEFDKWYKGEFRIHDPSCSPARLVSQLVAGQVLLEKGFGLAFVTTSGKILADCMEVTAYADGGAVIWIPMPP
jgi:hypothetical protein